MRILWWGSPGFLGSVFSSGTPRDPGQGTQSGSTLGWGAGGGKGVKEPDPNTAQPGAPCAGDKDKPGEQGVPGCSMGTFEEPPISPNSHQPHGLKLETSDLSSCLGAPQPQRNNTKGSPGGLQIPSAPSNGGGGAIPEDPVAVQGVLEGSPHHPHPEHVLGPRHCPQHDTGSPAVLQAGEALWL